MTGAAISFVMGDHHTFGITNVTVTSVSAAPNTAKYELQNDGDISKEEATVVTDIGDWITPKDSFDDYEARATIITGTLTSGDLDTWLNLGTTRAWSLTNPAAGTTETASFTLEIRRTGSTFIRDSATIALSAQRT